MGVTILSASRVEGITPSLFVPVRVYVCVRVCMRGYARESRTHSLYSGVYIYSRDIYYSLPKRVCWRFNRFVSCWGC